MPKKKYSQNYLVNPQLQKVFIVLVVATLLFQLGTIGYWATRTYHYNHNLSSFLMPALDTLLFPFLLFAAAYLLRSRKTSARIHVFDSLFYMAFGVLFYGLLSGIVNQLYPRLINPMADSYWQFVSYNLAVAAVTLLLFILFILRTKKA